VNLERRLKNHAGLLPSRCMAPMSEFGKTPEESCWASPFKVHGTDVPHRCPPMSLFTVHGTNVLPRCPCNYPSLQSKQSAASSIGSRQVHPSLPPTGKHHQLPTNEETLWIFSKPERSQCFRRSSIRCNRQNGQTAAGNSRMSVTCPLMAAAATIAGLISRVLPVGLP
jgi:hypothetical protein